MFALKINKSDIAGLILFVFIWCQHQLIIQDTLMSMPEKQYWNIQSVENSSDYLSWANWAYSLTYGTETVDGKTVGWSTNQCSGTKQYYVLYYYALPGKKESSFKNIPDETVKIFIKYWPPSTYLFNILCDETGYALK